MLNDKPMPILQYVQVATLTHADDQTTHHVATC